MKYTLIVFLEGAFNNILPATGYKIKVLTNFDNSDALVEFITNIHMSRFVIPTIEASEDQEKSQ